MERESTKNVEAEHKGKLKRTCRTIKEKEGQKLNTKNGTIIGLVNMTGANETTNVDIRRCLGLPQ